MASLHARKGSYQLRWRDPDGTNRAHTVSNRKLAEKLRYEIQRAEEAGERWLTPGEVAKLDLVELGNAWLRECRQLRAAGTVLQRELALTDFLAMLGANERYVGPDALTQRALRRYYEQLVVPVEREKKRRRGCNPSTAAARVRMVEAWWRWLTNQDDLVGVVPAARRIELPHQLPAQEVVSPTWEEMDQVCATAWLSPSGCPWVGQLFLVLRFTGLRVLQAMSLRWTDIEGNILRIRPELGKTRQEKSGRRIPLSPHLAELLQHWGPCPQGFVVHAPPARQKRYQTYEQFWERSGVRPAVWKAQDQDGQRRWGHSTHAFRKGVQTGLLEAGAPLIAVEVLLGHALPGVVGHYTDKQRLKLDEVVVLIPALPKSLRASILDVPKGLHLQQLPTWRKAEGAPFASGSPQAVAVEDNKPTKEE